MKIDDMKNVSVFGRVAYAVMCFENYAVNVYPNIDFSPVVEIMWSIIDGSNYIDESAYRYNEIVPECLFEFNSYENSDFENLTKEEYNLFKSILNESDDDLNVLMKSIYDIAMSYAYTKVENGAPAAIPHIQKVTDILSAHGIALPDMKLVAEYTSKNSNRLGDCFDGRYLSVVLKQKI